MIKAERKKVNNVDYIVTDYMFNNDNIGINLDTLNSTKTNKMLNISCIPISYSENQFNSSSSMISVISNLSNSGEKIYMNFNITYPDKTDIQQIIIPDNEFATDMINTCILDKKDIKEMPCYKNNFDNMINKIKEESLAQNILIKTSELNYKCYVYTDDLVFLGTANRLLENKYSAGQYVLGEYCGKNLGDYIDEYGDTTKLVIDMCITKDITLQFRNIELLDTIKSTFGYASIDMSKTKVVRISNNHTDITYKLPETLILPEYKPNYNHDNYYERFLIGNSPTDIEKFYKLNKVSTNPTININQYLMW